MAVRPARHKSSPIRPPCCRFGNDLQRAGCSDSAKWHAQDFQVACCTACMRCTSAAYAKLPTCFCASGLLHASVVVTAGVQHCSPEPTLLDSLRLCSPVCRICRHVLDACGGWSVSCPQDTGSGLFCLKSFCCSDTANVSHMYACLAMPYTSRALWLRHGLHCNMQLDVNSVVLASQLVGVLLSIKAAVVVACQPGQNAEEASSTEPTWGCWWSPTAVP